MITAMSPEEVRASACSKVRQCPGDGETNREASAIAPCRQNGESFAKGMDSLQKMGASAELSGHTDHDGILAPEEAWRIFQQVSDEELAEMIERHRLGGHIDPVGMPGLPGCMPIDNI